MTTPFDVTVSHITPLPTTVNGLKFFPSLEPLVSNDQDHPAFGWPSGPEVSDCNLAVVEEAMLLNGNLSRAVLEIGVHRNDGRSMTNLLMDRKLDSCVYLGVDIDDKSHLDDIEKSIYTVRCSSHDQRKVREKLRALGVASLDIIMIDGWHSVNTCVNDWCYADLLSPGGIVLLHDTNAHPGSVALFHAIDERLYHKERRCVSDTDMGIALVRKRS